VSDSNRHWLEVRVGITSEEAIAFLEELADDEELRDRLTESPREVLLERKIDLLPGTEPSDVRLPPPEEIRAYAQSLRERSGFAPDNPASHGFAVLAVSHGAPPPPPPPPPEE
jgi:hypothetical protein